MKRAVNILIADDHGIFRRGLREILTEHFPRANVFEAATARETLQIVHAHELQVGVLDITLPDRSGLEVMADLKKASPRLPVLILSAHPENQYALRVIKAGAAGYLTKDKAPAELVQAVEKVLAGGKYITPTLAEKLAAELTGKQTRAPHEKLSERELQILQKLAIGKSIKEISADLGIAVQTVSTHRARLLKKMELQKNADLVRYAIEHRLVD